MTPTCNTNQEASMEVGATSSIYCNIYDSDTGDPLVITGTPSLGSVIAALSGKITVANDAGKLKVTVNTTGMTPSLTTLNWWNATVTVNGSSFSAGGQIIVYTKVEDVITGPTTLTQDYPTGTTVTHVTITGTGTVDFNGHKINADATLNASYYLVGRVYIGGVAIVNGGSSSIPTISVRARGSGDVVLADGASWGASGQAMYYDGTSCVTNGHVEIGAIHVKNDSLIYAGNTIGSVVAQIYLKGRCNSANPPTISPRCVVEWSWCTLDNFTNLQINGIYIGQRCGWTGLANARSGAALSFGQYYGYASIVDTFASQVANIACTGILPPIDPSGCCISLGGDWCIRAIGAGTTVTRGLVTGESYSDPHLDLVGHASTVTSIKNWISLPTTVHDPNRTNQCPRAHIRGGKVTIEHATALCYVGSESAGPFVQVLNGLKADSLQSNLVYKMQVNRGVSITGDCSYSPFNAGGTAAESITGSPPLPATNTSRSLVTGYNSDYSSVSTGGDTYVTYGFAADSDQTSHDVSGDPGLATPSFSILSLNANIISHAIAGTSGYTPIDIYNMVVAAVTPSNPAFHNTAHDGTDIGAVPVQVSTAGMHVKSTRQFRNRALVRM